MSGSASIATLALVLALGGFPWRLRGERGWTVSLVRAFLAGAVVLHLALELLAAVGLRWSLVPLLAVAVAAQAVAFRWRDRLRPGPAVAPTWGDGVALAAVACFAAFAGRLQAVTPDFVYHWGSKARRFAHAGGIDFDFLALNSAFRLRPDYPCLPVDLAAMPGALFGNGSIAAALAPSLAAFALMPLVARELLARTGAGTQVRAALLAAWTLVIARFAIGHRMGGQADLLLALAVTAALPALLEPRGTSATRDLALAATVAAAAKTEGLALALLLVGVHAAQGAIEAFRSGRAVRHVGGRLSLPLLAVAISAGPWLLRNARHDLAGIELIGDYRWQRALEATGEIARWLAGPAAPEWSLWPLAALAAIPLLLSRRRTRAVALLGAGSLVLAVAAYSGGAPEVGRWVASSFPRLLFHWVPAVLLAIALEGARATTGGVENGPARVGSPRAATGRRIRRAVPWLVAAAAAGWATVGFVRGVEQVRHLRERFTREAPAERAGIRSPWSFRPYTPEVVALGELLGAPGARIPARSTVVIEAPPESDRTLADRLWSWAHVHRADLDFVRPWEERSRDRASYWLALGAAPGPPSGEPVASGRAGRLYRLGPGAAGLPDGSGRP